MNYLGDEDYTGAPSALFAFPHLDGGLLIISGRGRGSFVRTGTKVNAPVTRGPFRDCAVFVELRIDITGEIRLSFYGTLEKVR